MSCQFQFTLLRAGVVLAAAMLCSGCASTPKSVKPLAALSERMSPPAPLESMASSSPSKKKAAALHISDEDSSGGVVPANFTSPAKPAATAPCATGGS